MDFLKAAGMIVGGIFIGLIVVLFGIVAMFLFAIFGALIGAITGWILTHTPILGEAVKSGFTSVFGVESPDLVAIGAMLGFIAGFFKQWDHKDEGKGKEEVDEEKMKEWCKDFDIPKVHIDIEPKPKSKRSKRKK
jgi:hypothetical protein